MKTIHLLIKGKVQGVFYRATAKEKAAELRLSGWIKNTDEGHVEAVASGTEDGIEAFITWCKKGPSGAEVNSVDVIETGEKISEGFLILRR